MKDLNKEAAERIANEIYFYACCVRERSGSGNIVFMSIPLFQRLCCNCCNSRDFVERSGFHYFRGFRLIIYHSEREEYIIAGDVVRSLA